MGSNPRNPATCSFAGCELLGGLGTLVSSWENLISLDLSGTAVDDADVQLIGSGSMGDTGGRCTSCGPAVVRPQYAASS